MRLAEEIGGGHPHWTRFVFGVIKESTELPQFHPLRAASRLQSMADAQVLAAVPEGVDRIASGTVISAQLLI